MPYLCPRSLNLCISSGSVKLVSSIILTTVWSLGQNDEFTSHSWLQTESENFLYLLRTLRDWPLKCQITFSVACRLTFLVPKAQRPVSFSFRTSVSVVRCHKKLLSSQLNTKWLLFGLPSQDLGFVLMLCSERN